LITCNALSEERNLLEEKDFQSIHVYTEQVYPLNYTLEGKDDGEIVGIATELLVAILKEADITYEINMVPWSRAMHFIDSQENVLVYSMNRTSVREDLYHWVGEIFPVHVYLYGMEKNKDQLPNTLEEAKAFDIGTLRGGAVYDYLHKNGFTNLKIIKSVDRYMPLIERDRFDLFPFFEFSLVMSARRLNVDPNQFIRLMEIEELHTKLFFALSKNTNKEIVTKLKNAYQKIKDDGRYQSIIAKLKSPSIRQ